MRLLARLLLLSALAPASSLAAPGAVPPELHDRVARDGRVMVVAELAETALPEGWLSDAVAVRAQRQRVIQAQIEAIYALGGSDAGAVRPYPVVPFLALEVGPQALAALEASPWVRGVRAAEAHVPHLDSSVPVTEADQAQAIGLDGSGQAIVVLDTGTDVAHQNFPPGKTLDEACFASGAITQGPFTKEDPDGGDCPGGGDTAFGPGAATPCDFHSGCFHGTHVAGIAAGEGAYPGVATGAGLIPIQVFSEFPSSEPGCGGVPCPKAWDFDQDAALLYVHDTLRLSHDIAAVNLSLGSGAYTSPCDSSFASTKAAIDQLRSVGIATVVSTGNNSCGGTGCTDAISSPACISSAVSVSALRDNDADTAYANRAPFMSLFAPGHSVTGPRYFTGTGYITSSGTSMAAPHVAGAFAILRQGLPLDVSSLLAALQDSGQPKWMGVNRIRIHAALAWLGAIDCDDGLDNDGDGLVDLADPACSDGGEPSEQSPLLPCDDGLDNDGDGLVDLADPGCFDPTWGTESPACNDGIDNDGDGGIDYDGAPADAQCTAAHRLSEEASASCGLGGEPALLVAALLAARRRRRRR